MDISLKADGLISRGLDMRPAAQVREGIALVERNFRLYLLQRVAVFVQPAFFQAVDQFHLVGLVLKTLAGSSADTTFLTKGTRPR